MGALFFLGLLPAAPLRAQTGGYAGLLTQAVVAMEVGKQAQAANALRTAITLDRNEPMGLVALGALYLHTGSPVRARAEFERARALGDNDLSAFGLALAGLAAGKTDPAPFDALAGAIPTAKTMATYARLMAGGTADVRAEFAGVTVDEPDPLRLQIAAFAALRGGDGPGGEALMGALLARPNMARLAEDRALVLPFEPGRLAEAGAPALASAIEFAPARGLALSGRVTLAPGPLPDSATYVSYTVDPGPEPLYSAASNTHPFAMEWNTARIPNGLHVLQMTAYDGLERLVRQWKKTVHVQNNNAPGVRRFRPAEAADLRARLLVLLTPRPSRKAAHFALAERAAARGDSAGALQHVEAVVAIDPNFHNARLSLRRYNLAVEGPKEGLWRARTARKLIALTFDDGPDARNTPPLLDALRAEGARATFFVVGLRAEQAPDLLRRMVADGHDVENHTYSHQNLVLLTPPSVERELCRTSVIIREATGRRPKFYRPPGGNVSHSVSNAAEAMGMTGAYWTTAATKQEEAASPAALVRYVLDKAVPGGIILLHNGPDVTTRALPEIVRGLRARGYELVTISELVRRSAGTAPIAAKPPAKRGAFGG